MPSLDTKDKTKLLRLMLLSRAGDLREQSLIRQGKGWFHVSGMGHEALAVAGYLLRDGDMLAGYYRDRAIAMARGVSNYELALSFFAKQASPSGGRQMPAHFSNRELGIFSISSVVSSSLLPAVGLAWSMKLDGKDNVVVTSTGDAASRQGDFFESVAFAIEKKLPVIFLVEDNGIGISTVTEKIHPLALKMLNDSQWQVIDGCDADNVFEAIHPALEATRSGTGPRFIWCRTERISSHSSADDHRKYRSEEELAGLEDKDPINRLKVDLIQAGELTENEFTDLKESIEKEVRLDYERAFEEVDPAPEELLNHVLGPSSQTPSLELSLETDQPRMVDSINAVFHAALKKSRDFVFFGQDIEDPKGGVFSLTKGLSTQAPEQVFNSPLAEATIIGTAVGMGAYGKRPVFEIQFTDFIWPGFNQLVSQLSTLHWRTNGEWRSPAIIYAPYGAYLPGGALWHSQANEGALAHFPGLQIAIPSRPDDAAGLFWTAMHGNSPTLFLIPKHLMWTPMKLDRPFRPIPFGRASIRKEGTDLTIVTWGNCCEIVEAAVEALETPDLIEVIDMRTVVPLDITAVERSVARTGRLLVVQEDAESCSVGQSIISRISGNRELFSRLQAPPSLLAKPDVNIGYNPVLEYAAKSRSCCKSSSRKYQRLNSHNRQLIQ
jgi:2-oxoisovalerate dehydrogenase E1 component